MSLRGALALGLVAAVAAPGPAAAAEPDPLFTAGGGMDARAVGLTPVAGGGIVVGGQSRDAAVIARYSADGALVGPVVRAPGALLAAVAPTPDGGVLAAASRLVAGRYQPEMLRTALAGGLVPRGVAPVGDGDAFARALVTTPDGGSVLVVDAERARRRVVAILRQGTPATFLSLPGRDLTAAGAATGPDGTVVVAGTAFDSPTGASDPFVARLDAAGRITAGPALLHSGAVNATARAVAVDPEGRALVAGSGRVRDRSVLLVVRATGAALDSAFGAGGVVALRHGSGDAYARAVAAATDGSVWLAGAANPSPALVHLTPSGATAPAFGALTGYPGSDATPAAISVDSAGRLLVAGSAFDRGREVTTHARLLGP